MKRAANGLARGARPSLGLLALVLALATCARPGETPTGSGPSAGAARSTASAPAQPAHGPIGPAGARPEKNSLKIGLAVASITLMPLYVAAEGAFQEEGLDVELLSFR